ncbi:MAG: phosphate/phosphite/phosphonate ABC transporter substrate-binding protein [Bacteroidota bacterium]
MLNLRIIAACLVLLIGTTTNAQQVDTVNFSAAHYFSFEKIKSVCDYLTANTSAYFKAVPYDDFKHLEEGFKNDKFGVAFVSPLDYVLLKDHNPELNALVALGSEGEKKDSFQSCVITFPGSKIKKVGKHIEDFKTHKITFVQPHSTAGHLIPRVYFASFGVEPIEDYFEEVEFAGSHRNVILSVANRIAEIGACSYPEIEYAIEAGLIDKNDIEIIWKSNPIPDSPMVVRTSLDLNLINEIRLAMQKIHLEPELWDHIKHSWGATKPEHFIETTDETYNSVRRILVGLGNFEKVLGKYMGRF